MEFIIKVNDMTCKHCVASIEEALSKIKDLKSSHVDLASKTVSGEFDEKKIDLNVIKTKINDIGFTAL